MLSNIGLTKLRIGESSINITLDPGEVSLKIFKNISSFEIHYFDNFSQIKLPSIDLFEEIFFAISVVINDKTPSKLKFEYFQLPSLFINKKEEIADLSQFIPETSFSIVFYIISRLLILVILFIFLLICYKKFCAFSHRNQLRVPSIMNSNEEFQKGLEIVIPPNSSNMT